MFRQIIFIVISTMRLLLFLFTLFLAIVSIGMLLTISQYFSSDTTIGFLFYKQYIVDNKLWLNLFYVHVFTCFICVFAGFTQFSKDFLQQYPTLHRVLGRIYFYNIILINFPVGFILALNANGHVPGKMAFLTLDVLWVYFTISAVVYIKKGFIEKHRKQMIRSYSLTLTALTLRLLKMFMLSFSNWGYNEIYVFDAWMALIINLIVSELIIYYPSYLVKRKLVKNR